MRGLSASVVVFVWVLLYHEAACLLRDDAGPAGFGSAGGWAGSRVESWFMIDVRSSDGLGNEGIAGSEAIDRCDLEGLFRPSLGRDSRAADGVKILAFPRTPR
jgi:hypothetical protein